MIVNPSGILAASAALVLTVAAGPFVIRVLSALRFGQQVRSDGPQTHHKKTGTPSMGGLLIISTAGLTAWIAGRDHPLVLPALAVVFGFSLIGFVDDYLSVRSNRSLGLKARHKILSQAILGLATAIFALVHPDVGPVLILPFSGAEFVLPQALYLVIVMTAIVGTTNAVNLTDGLDGLAAGTTGIAAAAFAVIAFAAEMPGMGIFAASFMGACLGFLWYNGHPAAVFMGDTGSLGLGAFLAVIAIFSRSLLWLPIVGGVFVVETLSVIVQVAWFRRTGRRLLRMAPLHHNFELGGWQEPQIVTRFVLVGVLCALLGLLGVRAL